MDSIKLRTLTKKSSANGLCKYNRTIGELLNFNPAIVWSIYCRKEKISFTDDILDEISKSYPLKRINKPGIDPEQINDFFNSRRVDYDSIPLPQLKKLIQAKYASHTPVRPEAIQALRKKKTLSKLVKDKPVFYSKSSLQGKNHGR